jgi:3-hydroxybutyrate dehydrogenase
MSQTNRLLFGHTAVVTGGASGMGAAIAIRLASLGANVAIGSLLTKDAGGPSVIAHYPHRNDLDRVRDEIKTHQVSVFADEIDVAHEQSVDSFCSAAESALGPVTVLVTAAGISIEHGLSEHPWDAWGKVMRVNLDGTALCIRRLLPNMLKARRGRIVTIASTAASVGASRSSAYCASKAGVVALSRCVALEGAAYGITCNSISPSWVNTDLAKLWMKECAANEGLEGGSAAYRAAAERQNPQGRLIQPNEIAALAAFLCSEEAAGITGQDIVISGGSLW